MARPTKFSEDAFDVAMEHYNQGATDAQVAETLKVTETTINNWKIKYPKFFESIKEAKGFCDRDVEESLFKRAKGFVRVIQKIDKDGCIHDVEEELPPDPTSMIFWLKNRKPKEWRDKQEVEQSGNINVTVNVNKKER